MNFNSRTSSHRVWYAFFAILSCFLLWSGEMRAAQLAAGAITLAPGSSGTLDVAYTSMGDQVSSLQFDLGFDSSVLSLTVVPASSIRSSGKSFYEADLGAGSRRIVVTGLNENTLSDGP